MLKMNGSVGETCCHVEPPSLLCWTNVLPPPSVYSRDGSEGSRVSRVSKVLFLFGGLISVGAEVKPSVDLKIPPNSFVQYMMLELAGLITVLNASPEHSCVQAGLPLYK